MAAGILDRNEENLKRWLSDPEEVKPGNIMAREAPVYTNPDLALSASDIDALVAYLQSLE
jgi:cytochrome c oxidase subunit 2